MNGMSHRRLKASTNNKGEELFLFSTWYRTHSFSRILSLITGANQLLEFSYDIFTRVYNDRS